MFLACSRRNLTPTGKVVVTCIKTLGLPKLSHLIMGFSNPSEETITVTVLKLYVTNFYGIMGQIKEKSNDITQPYKKGGLRMLDIDKNFYKYSKNTWLRKMFARDSKYCNLVKLLYPFIYCKMCLLRGRLYQI